ncbi:predicted protein [Lichtheimia corymbifera JMRC:FSU:9682]|uniref:Uncharacterized protein n=1 Tax=Lichtheimia corymbifera JMRC:FSU:9682 TaxID=1263082 RepID=A0A068RN32_9FUNG|nr:predicted protein [Lichtheimia corymbifera JMRC:FSU:9682]
MSSRPQPQQLNSQSLNPATVMEINVLKRVAMEQQRTNPGASIPYFAKICQIVDNQRPPDNDPMRLNIIRADAHAQLADAYHKVQNWIQCEASLMVAVKIWERMLETPEETDGKMTARTRLGEAIEVFCFLLGINLLLLCILWFPWRLVVRFSCPLFSRGWLGLGEGRRKGMAITGWLALRPVLPSLHLLSRF